VLETNVVLWIATCNQQGLRLFAHFSTDSYSVSVILSPFHVVAFADCVYSTNVPCFADMYIFRISSLVHADCVYSGSSEGVRKGDAHKDRPARLRDQATDSCGDPAHPRRQRHHMQPEAGEDQRNHQCPDLESAFQAEEWGVAAAVGQQVDF